MIRIDMWVRLHADLWSEAAGSDPGDAARDACWYLSDARDSIPHIGEDGCPADLRTLPGWSEEQDILGGVEIRALWRVDCPAADWITWRADPACCTAAHTVPPGKARQDLARTVIDGMAGMALFVDSHAVVTLRSPWRQVYDHRQWAARPST
ncbi:hypothetical protein [Kitasatospora sp. NPDC015120]|uniref:hypothetical protein n=1 Tax=Kitasatospora sp. NPDC015120 TaxID=3364023 RepID=UPI0036F44F58